MFSALKLLTSSATYDLPLPLEQELDDTTSPRSTLGQRAELCVTYVDGHSRRIFANKDDRELQAQTARFATATALAALQVRLGRPLFIVGHYTTTGKRLRYASLIVTGLHATLHAYEVIRRQHRVTPEEATERQIAQLVDSVFTKLVRTDR